MYGTLTQPRTDVVNDFEDTVITSVDGGNKILIETWRKAAPADSIGKDFAIQCGKDFNFMWMIKPSGQNQVWQFSTNSDCSMKEDNNNKQPD